ncbi:uncharacterized protein TNCV_3356211 [Trichonephila clavipes]|nr:uncharacterized protein TNCV_3356211 [Trichonephila clavipes]
MEEIGGLGIPLRSLWPTLHCRRVEGVSPLLSIGWWYLSSVSPKRHCCRVSAVPDCCQLTGTLPPLLDSVVGGGTPGRRCLRVYMDPMLMCPGKGFVLPNLTIDQIATHRLILQLKKSHFYILAKSFLDSPVNISPHKALNTSRGVISEPDLLTTPEAEILDGFSDQGVIKSQQLLNSLHQLRHNSYHPSLLSKFLPRLHLPHPQYQILPACPVKTTITTSNNIPSTSQDVKQISKPRKKKCPPKNTSNSIKQKIEIKMAPHKSRKPAPVEYITNEENMIVYDIEEVETTKSIVRRLSEGYWRNDDSET